MRESTDDRHHADDTGAYIGYLHDRISYLERELEDAEETILQLRTQPSATGRADLAEVGRYIDFLESTYDSDDEQVAALTESLEAKLDARLIADNDDFHHVTLALWQLLKDHEELARRD